MKKRCLTAEGSDERWSFDGAQFINFLGIISANPHTMYQNFKPLLSPTLLRAGSLRQLLVAHQANQVSPRGGCERMTALSQALFLSWVPIT
jgi:hypothetical protein